LKITFKGKTTREFKMVLSYLDCEDFQYPKEKLPIRFTIPTKFLKDSIKDIAAYSGEVKFIVNHDSLFLIGKNKNVKIKNRFEHGVDVDGIYRSEFYAERVNNILKSGNLNENCILSLGDDMPIEFTFCIGENSFIRYILAPLLTVEEN
jgi:DNA polymerase III sliding clamp (beta) subunit (PCNA family)